MTLAQQQLGPRDQIRWWLNEFGVRLNGISVMFDLISACSFRCPSCPVGNSKPRSGAIMKFEKFRTYLDTIERECKIRYVLLYSFSEPTLHPEVHRFVKECKDRGIGRVIISTNLSRPERLEKCFAAGFLDTLRISFSGFENGEYFHMGRKMSQFVAGARTVSELMHKYPGVRVELIFHEYGTNLHELTTVKRFAVEHGFELIEETAFFIPYEKIVEKNYSPEDLELISHLQKTPEESTANAVVDNICYYQQKQLCIDVNGDVYLCRHMYDERFVVGSLERNTVAEVRTAMADHSFCLECKSRGLNKYTP